MNANTFEKQKDWDSRTKDHPITSGAKMTPISVKKLDISKGALKLSKERRETGNASETPEFRKAISRRHDDCAGKDRGSSSPDKDAGDGTVEADRQSCLRLADGPKIPRQIRSNIHGWARAALRHRYRLDGKKHHEEGDKRPRGERTTSRRNERWGGEIKRISGCLIAL